MKMPPLFFFALAFAAGLPVQARAADEELARLEREYFEKRRALVRPLVAAYIDKLKGLQETLVRRGDQPRVLAVGNEINCVSASPSPPQEASIDTGPNNSSEAEVAAASGTATLSLDKAELSGGATINLGFGTISLASKGAAAQWKLPRLRAGRYRLLMDYICPALNGGRYQLTFAGKPPIDLVAAPTREGTLLAVDLGEHEFISSPVTLRIEVTELAPRAAILMNLLSIRLQPAGRAG